MRLLLIIALISMTGCVRVRAYNQRVYAECVAEHHGETWTWQGLPMTCKPLPYPSFVSRHPKGRFADDRARGIS